MTQELATTLGSVLSPLMALFQRWCSCCISMEWPTREAAMAAFAKSWRRGDGPCAHRHSGGLHDAADHNAVSEHVEIVVVPFARRARSGGALEDQIVLVHFTEPICAVSLDHLVGAGEQHRRHLNPERPRG